MVGIPTAGFHVACICFQILRRYRFDRDGIAYIEDLIGGALLGATQRSNALTPSEQILSALRYYATGSMQIVLGDASGVSQPSISRSVAAVTRQLVAISDQFISMPGTPEATRLVRY